MTGPVQYATLGDLYLSQEVSFIPNMDGKGQPTYSPSDRTIENDFQKEMALGVGSYTLRATSAITPVKSDYQENFQFKLGNEQNGTPIWLQADYTQEAASNKNMALTVGQFTKDAGTETGKIEYFTLNHFDNKMLDLTTIIDKNTKTVVDTYNRDPSKVKRELADLETQQLFNGTTNPIDFTTPYMVGGVQVGIIVDYKLKAESIGKYLDGLYGKQQATREANAGTPEVQQQITAATAAKNKAEAGMNALVGAGFSKTDKAYTDLQAQAGAAQKTLDQLAATPLDGQIRQLEALKAESERLSNIGDGKTTIVLSEFGDELKNIGTASTDALALRQGKKDFLKAIENKPGWFQFERPLTDKKDKPIVDAGGTPVMETVYGRVPLLDGDKATAVR